MTAPMNFNDYQDFTDTTAQYPEEGGDTYVLLGLAGETGEVCDLVKKAIRSGKPVNRDDLRWELGDVLYYLARVAREFGFTFEEIAYSNKLKLENRMRDGTIKER